MARNPRYSPCHARSTKIPEVMKMPRSLDELIAQADKLADQFEAYEPEQAERGEPVLLTLRRIAYQRSLLERELKHAVRKARRVGESWTRIGSELGTSGEAARQRYGDCADDSTAQSTVHVARAGAARRATSTGRSLTGLKESGGRSLSRKAEKREVVPNANGGWDVRKPGSPRASAHAETQQQAEQRAREILRNAGGGELRIKGKDGKIRSQNTVPKRDDSRRGTG